MLTYMYMYTCLLYVSDKLVSRQVSAMSFLALTACSLKALVSLFQVSARALHICTMYVISEW